MSAAHDPADDTVPIRRGDRGAAAGGDVMPGRAQVVLEPGRVAGIGRKVPIVYGARPAAGSPAPPTAAVSAGPEEGPTSFRSEPLPSFHSRERRLRTLTLAAYAGCIALSITGLCVIAFVAFG